MPRGEGAKFVEGRYEREEQVGEGTYGRVWRARCLQGPHKGAQVALKKLSLDEEKLREAGFPITAIREIEILNRMSHENVVRLYEVATSRQVLSNAYKGSIYMVFEYMEHDLGGMLDLPGFSLSLPQIKCMMRQILEGVNYCHRLGVMHRDMKASNILMNSRGELKLADFGLSRKMDADGVMTGRVITLWTRPPELLLGDRRYSFSVDMWSVGCIFAQLLLGKPLLRGKDEDGQMRAIMEMCGTPQELDWPGVSSLKWYKHFTEGGSGTYRRRLRDHLRSKLPHLSESGADLVDRLLVLNPAKRLTAAQALEHAFFREAPVACEKWQLPQPSAGTHEFAVKSKVKADIKAGHQVRGYQGLQPGPPPGPPPGEAPPAKRAHYGEVHQHQLPGLRMPVMGAAAGYAGSGAAAGGGAPPGGYAAVSSAGTAGTVTSAVNRAMVGNTHLGPPPLAMGPEPPYGGYPEPVRQPTLPRGGVQAAHSLPPGQPSLGGQPPLPPLPRGPPPPQGPQGPRPPPGPPNAPYGGYRG